MGTFLGTVIALTFVYGGTAGIELIMARYATPEARSLERSQVPAPGHRGSTVNPCGDDAASP